LHNRKRKGKRKRSPISITVTNKSFRVGKILVLIHRERRLNDPGWGKGRGA